MSSSSTPVTALAALRTAVGVGAWLAPRTTGKLFGLAVDSAEAVLMARLFGVRDVALGLATLQTDGAARRTLVQAGIACDVLDAAAAALGARRGGIGRLSAAAVAAVALTAAATGAAAARPA